MCILDVSSSDDVAVAEAKVDSEGGVLVFWLVLVGECVCMTLIAEWLCVRSELAAIPLPSALLSAGSGEARANAAGGVSPSPSPAPPPLTDAGASTGAGVSSTGATEERTHNGRRYVRLKELKD